MAKQSEQLMQKREMSLCPPHPGPLPEGRGNSANSARRWSGGSEEKGDHVCSFNSFGVIILVISVCFFMCAGSGRKLDEPDLARKIIGEWEWVESFGGFAGERRTPETEGYTKAYVFRADHTFLQYRDDALFATRKYKIAEKVVWKKERAKVLDIEGMTEQIIGFDGNDTLRLTGHCIDCFSELFVRIGRE